SIAAASRPLIPPRFSGCGRRNTWARPPLRGSWALGGPQSIGRSRAVITSRNVIPTDSLVQLRQRLDRLPPTSPERAAQVAAVAQMYGVSAAPVSRAL